MGQCFGYPENKSPVLDDVSPNISQLKFEDTIPFVLPLERCSAKVLKVYDGDTITIGFSLYGSLYRTQVRLLGIDTPELKGATEEERAKARAAKDALSELILGKVVLLRNTKTKDKYGRLLADLMLGEVFVNSYMLEEGFARPYDGKTKSVWGSNF